MTLGQVLILGFALTIAGQAQEYDTIFRGRGPAGDLIAVSVPTTVTSPAIEAIATRLSATATVVVYRDYRNVSSSGPVAVFEQGKSISSPPRLATTATGATIGATISSATRPGARTGAVCRDGSSSAATGSGACSRHGGVARWITANSADPTAVVATICSDYLLKSGSGGCPNGTKMLAQILNRSY
jgi:hypothetical protein